MRPKAVLSVVDQDGIMDPDATLRFFGVGAASLGCVLKSDTFMPDNL